MANKTGYMDKERAESEKRQKEYLAWLKSAQAESKAIHKKFQSAMDKLATETKEKHKKFIASNREYTKTLGKFDDNREAIRKVKY